MKKKYYNNFKKWHILTEEGFRSYNMNSDHPNPCRFWAQSYIMCFGTQVGNRVAEKSLTGQASSWRQRKRCVVVDRGMLSW